MSFRPATLADSGWLYKLRLEDEDGPWYDDERTGYGAHLAWLTARLNNPLVQILVWTQGEGVCRIDSNGELSFHGPARMIADLTRESPRKLKATVDHGDPKALLLQQAGFTTYPAIALVYKP